MLLSFVEFRSGRIFTDVLKIALLAFRRRGGLRWGWLVCWGGWGGGGEKGGFGRFSGRVLALRLLTFTAVREQRYSLENS